MHRSKIRTMDAIDSCNASVLIKWSPRASLRPGSDQHKFVVYVPDHSSTGLQKTVLGDQSPDQLSNDSAEPELPQHNLPQELIPLLNNIARNLSESWKTVCLSFILLFHPLIVGYRSQGSYHQEYNLSYLKPGLECLILFSAMVLDLLISS